MKNHIQDNHIVPNNQKLKQNSVTDNTTEDGDAEPQNKEIPSHVAQDATASVSELPGARPAEHGGQKGLEPTRFGDWEKKGRCTDF